ncbi:MAG: magnesium chelatase domain-containing protein, partial [Pseudomonadota bacterium]
GVSFGQVDVYLNVAGGMRIAEPAADLAAAAALLSSFSGQPLPKDSVYFGEISLTGAIRPASQTLVRLKEAQKLGFGAAYLPNSGDLGKSKMTLALNRLKHLSELAGDMGANEAGSGIGSGMAQNDADSRQPRRKRGDIQRGRSAYGSGSPS